MPYIQIDHGRRNYERHGDGPPLMLIHGLGSSARDWRPQTDDFSRDRMVIATDLLGHGRSTAGKTGSVTIAGFARDVALLMDDQGIDQADVVGLSLGGAAAFQLAVLYPDRLRSLTIVNSAPAFVPGTWRERWMVWQRLLVIRLLGMRRRGRILARRLFPDSATRRALFVQQFAENDKNNDLRALNALIGWSVDAQLQTIRYPTLVVSADRDYTSVASKRRYVERMRDARLVVIRDARHAVKMERPVLFNDELRRFLARLSAPSPAAAMAGAVR